MQTTKAVLAAVAILTLSFSVIDSQAGRHRHRLIVKHYTAQVAFPASDVQSLAVTCPRGYKALGGGYVSDVIAVVPVAELAPNGYGVIAINQTNQAGKLEATVACLRGKTSARAASIGRARLERLEERFRAQR